MAFHGEGGGRGVQDGEHILIHVNVWQKKKKKKCPFSKAVQHPGIVHGILLNCSLEKDKLEEEGPWKGQVWIFVQDGTLDPKLPLLLLGTFPLQGLLVD